MPEATLRQRKKMLTLIQEINRNLTYVQDSEKRAAIRKRMFSIYDTYNLREL